MSLPRPTLPNVSMTAYPGSSADTIAQKDGAAEHPATSPAQAPAGSSAPSTEASGQGHGRGLVGRPLALSPSRAADFKQCPLLYRYRAIDRFPETPTQAQTRGTVVHAALENLFDLPAELRTRESAEFLVEGARPVL